MTMRRKKTRTATILSHGSDFSSARWLAFRFHSPRALLKFAALLVCLGSVVAGSPQTASKSKKAENPYALIYGTVWGPDSRPLYGVKIRIRRADQKKPHWELFSDHQGEFAQRVPAGQADYVILADLKGYKTPSGRRLRLPEDVKVHVTYDEREDVGVHLIY